MCAVCGVILVRFGSFISNQNQHEQKEHPDLVLLSFRLYDYV
jgi:hypothetical protein